MDSIINGSELNKTSSPKTTSEIPRPGENLPVDQMKVSSTNYSSENNAPVRSRFGFCLQCECCDGRCKCCI